MTQLPLRRVRPKPPRHLVDMSPEEVRDTLSGLGHPAFRAKQLAHHYFGRSVTDPALMTDLPSEGREQLVNALLPTLLTPLTTQVTDAGDTAKIVWRLHDGALIESVVMRYPDRITVCISSQAGCGMACPFCATGQNGLTRNLTAGEIVDQVVAANRMVRSGQIRPIDTLSEQPEAGRVTNVVFMGMGEALATYTNAVLAVRRLVDPVPTGLGMSARGVTLSTVGLVPAMDKFADEGLAVRLALSLHAPDDELRNELVPINTRWGVRETLDCARRYFDRTGRRVSIEYALMKDINDQVWRAQLLGRLLRERGTNWVHVNPIPLNPTPGSRWTASTPQAQDAFVATLRSMGIVTTVRDTRGREIDGACGQLAGAAKGERNDGGRVRES